MVEEASATRDDGTDSPWGFMYFEDQIEYWKFYGGRIEVGL